MIVTASPGDGEEDGGEDGAGDGEVDGEEDAPEVGEEPSAVRPDALASEPDELEEHPTARTSADVTATARAPGVTRPGRRFTSPPRRRPA